MKWVRKHVRHGARLALLALAVQFVLSFGHFHASAAQSAPLSLTTLTQADSSADLGFAALEERSESAQQPANHDNGQQPADTCAICVVLALANALLATPPPLLLPQAIELLRLITAAEFAHLDHTYRAFQSRAPPVS